MRAAGGSGSVADRLAACGYLCPRFLLAIPLGLAQAVGPWYLSAPARTFCTIIRGTPLLLQIWLIYYGFGSLFPQFPWIRSSKLWPYLGQAWPYAVVALTLSYAGYEGEVMRGAFSGVAKGQLEAARSFGMRRFAMFRRVWLPQAVRNVLPTLGGETILQLKATPLVATICPDLHDHCRHYRPDLPPVREPRTGSSHLTPAYGSGRPFSASAKDRYRSAGWRCAAPDCYWTHSRGFLAKPRKGRSE